VCAHESHHLSNPLDLPSLPAATSTQDSDISFTYVQGMNVLAAPFLFTMSEMEAFYAYSNLLKHCCPLYVQPTLAGVHCGIKVSAFGSTRSNDSMITLHCSM
jgi:hypothetical protein